MDYPNILQENFLHHSNNIKNGLTLLCLYGLRAFLSQQKRGILNGASSCYIVYLEQYVDSLKSDERRALVADLDGIDASGQVGQINDTALSLRVEHLYTREVIDGHLNVRIAADV